MKTPQILTGQQAIDQFGLNALIECRVAITTELNGLGHSVMQIGVIADPDNCFIDLSDEPAVLYVEIEQDDDWILHPIMADEQFVLLDDKNQQAKTYGAKTPEQIYLIPDAELGQVWCDTPAPGEGMREEDATRYVREDIYLAALAQVEQLREAGYRFVENAQESVELLQAKGDAPNITLLCRELESIAGVFESESTPAQCLAERDADAMVSAGKYLLGLVTAPPSLHFASADALYKRANQLRQKAKRGDL